VCREWRDSFVAFKAWAESNGYLENLTIDRIDNDGDYSPKNCRFVTVAENRNNSSTFRRTHRLAAKVMRLKAKGDSYPTIAETLGISKSTVFRIASSHPMKAPAPLG
jgi:hypothetical protein